MLSTLAVGLATGVGLWMLAAFATVFILVVLRRRNSLPIISELKRNPEVVIAERLNGFLQLVLRR
jgi:uncharacterized membrane protein YhiD involved in acid resistance